MDLYPFRLGNLELGRLTANIAEADPRPLSTCMYAACKHVKQHVVISSPTSKKMKQ